jgi:hypothetical protein
MASVAGPARVQTAGGGPAIEASSVELDDVTVTVSVSSSAPAFLGTLDGTAETRMIRVAINARSSGIPTAPNGASPPAVELPQGEQIAWVRVVLGELADHAYRIVTDMGMLRVRPAFFMVLVDSDGSARAQRLQVDPRR